MNSAVWEQCQALLPDWIDAIFVDLPGHGSMAAVNAKTIEDYVQALMPLVHRPVLWVGWSLGALAVIRLAELYPDRVASLFLVAANPCFVQRKNWVTAVDEATFVQFGKALSCNQSKTLRRFLFLQMQGLVDARQTVRQLQQTMEQRGSASASALKNGLQMLVETDYRDTLALLDCSVSWFLGGRDTLVPVELAEEIRRMYTQHKIYIEADAGHVPFLSHPERFVEALVERAAKLR